MKNTFIFLIALVLVFVACEQPAPDIKIQKSGLVADSAMVVSAHALASEVGAKILKQGGNAVDAAIAVQFALVGVGLW